MANGPRRGHWRRETCARHFDLKDKHVICSIFAASGSLPTQVAGLLVLIIMLVCPTSPTSQHASGRWRGAQPTSVHGSTSSERRATGDGRTADEGLHHARWQQHACKGFVRVKAHRLQLGARCSSAPRVLAPSALQADPCRHTSWGSFCTASFCTFKEPMPSVDVRQVARGSTCNIRLPHVLFLFLLFSYTYISWLPGGRKSCRRLAQFDGVGDRYRDHRCPVHGA